MLPDDPAVFILAVLAGLLILVLLEMAREYWRGWRDRRRFSAMSRQVKRRTALELLRAYVRQERRRR